MKIKKKNFFGRRGKRIAAFVLMAAMVLNLNGITAGFHVVAEGQAAGATSTSGDASADASTSAPTTAQEPTTQTPTTQAPSTTPAPITELKVSDQTMTSITVSWAAVNGVDGYILQTYNYTTKTWDPVDTITADKSLTNYTYVVNDMNAGTTHRFRMSTYIGTTANASSVVKSIKTGCKPGVPTITVTKGNKCARITWNAIKSAGYYVYQKTGNGAYEKIATLSGSANNTYLVKSLTNGQNYTFKVSAYSTYAATDNGYAYSNTLEGVSSNEETITPGSVSKTSSSPYLYSTVAKFKASPAYKTYALAKKVNTTKSFITPGVSITNVNGINSSNFVTQGSVCAGAYYLIGAYDSTGVENSVIYVMKRSTHKYIMTLVLPNKEKVTDMAYDGTNVWMTAGDYVACVRYKTITSKISTGVDSTTISYMNTYSTVSKPAYMAYYDGKLWVGTYSTTKNYMSGYTIGDKTSKKPTLTYYKRMQMFGKTKAIEIDSNGYLYVIRSHQVKKGLSGYVSQIRTYKPTWSTTSATVKKNANKKICKLPAMASGVTFYNTYAYINFDSAKEAECRYPTDRSWAVKLTNLR